MRQIYRSIAASAITPRRCTAHIDLQGAKVERKGKLTELRADTPLDENDYEHPERIICSTSVQWFLILIQLHDASQLADDIEVQGGTLRKYKFQILI